MNPSKPTRTLLVTFGPSLLLGAAAFGLAYAYVDPAPPKHVVISASDAEGDYQAYAKLYAGILKEDGVTLDIRPSSGAMENYRKLQDAHSDVEVGFVQDGIGSSDEAPQLSSLGSLYYEPLWIFYRGKAELGRFSQLAGKRVAIGRPGGGTRVIARRLLRASGVDAADATIVELGSQAGADALRAGQVDAAFFLGTAEEKVIAGLLRDPGVRLMSVDQAEAIARQYPYLHHLTLPHGAIDLKRNIPDHDVQLVAPTATLLIRDSLHPALQTLLLKAAEQVHSLPSLFEAKDEFPKDKDYEFTVSDEAKRYYKSGLPFWHRYLPFWIATLVERFILFVIPALAILVPLVRMIPQLLEKRVRKRIYQRYGELQFLETQIKHGGDAAAYDDWLSHLDRIEERVNHMKVPLDFSDHVYVLREHIDFVRQRIRRATAKP